MPPVQFLTRKNQVNGRFLKGHTPFNKGRKLEEYLSKQQIEYVTSFLSRTGHSNFGGWNKKEIAAVKDGKLICVFESARDAQRKTKIQTRNINSCCNKKRKRAGGYEWYFTNDSEFLLKLK